jgi:hypothetical protein
MQVAAPTVRTPRSSGKKPSRKPAASKARVAARPASKAPAAVAAAATPGSKGITGTVYNAAAAFLTGLKRRLSTA